MLHLGRGIFDLNIREGVSTAPLAHKHGVALRKVTRVLGALHDFYQTAIGVLAMAGTPIAVW